MPSDKPDQRDRVQADAYLEQGLAWLEEMGDEVDDLLEVSPTEYSARQCAIAQRTLKFAMAFAALSKSRELEENALHDLGDEVLRRNDQTHVSGFDP